MFFICGGAIESLFCPFFSRDEGCIEVYKMVILKNRKQYAEKIIIMHPYEPFDSKKIFFSAADPVFQGVTEL